jgi:pilus assembly protein CpaE
MGNDLQIFKLLDFFFRRNGKVAESGADTDHDTENGADHPSLVGIVGAKGGVGASTLAFNLAVAMSDFDSRVSLVDADFQQPALSVLTAHDPVYTIADLFSKGSHIEANIFEACTYGIEGLKNSPRFLVPPNDGDGAITLDPASLPNLLTRISNFSSLWLIDLPREIDRHLVELLDLCTEIILVVEPDLSSIAAARRWLNHFEDLGYDPANVLIVVNRSGGRLREVESQLAGNFPRWTLMSVPNAYEALQQCCLTGKSLVIEHPNHPYTKAVRALASLVKKRSHAGAVKTPVQI